MENRFRQHIKKRTEQAVIYFCHAVQILAPHKEHVYEQYSLSASVAKKSQRCQEAHQGQEIQLRHEVLCTTKVKKEHQPQDIPPTSRTHQARSRSPTSKAKKISISNNLILGIFDFQDVEPTFILAPEPTVLKLEGSSFGRRPYSRYAMVNVPQCRNKKSSLPEMEMVTPSTVSHLEIT